MISGVAIFRDKHLGSHPEAGGFRDVEAQIASCLD